MEQLWALSHGDEKGMMLGAWWGVEKQTDRGALRGWVGPARNPCELQLPVPVPEAGLAASPLGFAHGTKHHWGHPARLSSPSSGIPSLAFLATHFNPTSSLPEAVGAFSGEVPLTL